MTRAPFLIDALDLGVNTKGIHRVLVSVIPHLRAAGVPIVIATTSSGVQATGDAGDVLVVERTRQSLWEQWGLPRLAARHGCAAVYSHREAGALWGTPLVLHVPEDPEVRWAREPARDSVARLRRGYSRVLMGRSLARAAVVAASVPSVADDLARKHGLDRVATIPLGVDLDRFSPAETPREDCVFHLGSVDPRDGTATLVEAYARACRAVDLPTLIIGGDLGADVGRSVRAAVEAHALGDRVRLTGRLDDEALADLYANGLAVVQPSSDEGFGLQPLEALAAGARLIVADVPAVSDVVGAVATVVAANADALAAALVAATGSAGGAAQRRRARSAAGSYTWARTAEAILGHLDQAASRG